MRTTLFLALLLTGACASAADQARVLPPFSSVSSEGAVNLVVQVGKAQSVVIRGSDDYLAKIDTRVVNGELVISFPRASKNRVNLSSEHKVFISVPTLKAFHVEGAGSSELHNIQGDVVDISMHGAGRLAANGKVKHLKLMAQGVGDVDTKALLAQRAEVNFEGIGKVKVHASERLDAVVHGMGSLNYYGNPKTVNKSVEGIGSVSSGH